MNPATLLPVPDTSTTHNWKQILDTATGSRPDMRDQAPEKPYITLSTDRSGFIKDGQDYQYRHLLLKVPR